MAVDLFRSSSFSSLNPFSKACATPPTKGICSRGTYEKRKEIFWGQREKFLYSVLHKPSEVPKLWQGKMFLLFFITFFLRIVLFISGCLFQGSHCCFLEQSHCQWKSVICTVLLFL